MNSSSGKNPDPIPADAGDYLRRTIMRDQVQRLRKSPDTSLMYSIEVPALRIKYFQRTLKRHKLRISELRKLYPQYELITNQ
jgi:hypothetical protein